MLLPHTLSLFNWPSLLGSQTTDKPPSPNKKEFATHSSSERKKNARNFLLDLLGVIVFLYLLDYSRVCIQDLLKAVKMGIFH